MTPLLGATTDREYICKYSQRPTCDHYPKVVFYKVQKYISMIVIQIKHRLL